MTCLSSAVFAVFSGPPAENAGKSGFSDLGLLISRLHAFVNRGTIARVGGRTRRVDGTENFDSCCINFLWGRSGACIRIASGQSIRGSPLPRRIPGDTRVPLFPGRHGEEGFSAIKGQGRQKRVSLSLRRPQPPPTYFRLMRVAPSDPPTKISSGSDDRTITKIRPHSVIFSRST
jgi:hypothetical protein